MKVNINKTPLKKENLPKRYKRSNGITIDGYNKRIDLHQEDGFRDVIMPDYDNETHRLGTLMVVNDTVTYELVEIPPKTTEQLKQEAIANGVTVSNFHFATKTELNDFITQKNELEKLGLTEMGWTNAEDEWVTLQFSEVLAIFIQAMQGFQAIYMM